MSLDDTTATPPLTIIREPADGKKHLEFDEIRVVGCVNLLTIGDNVTLEVRKRNFPILLLFIQLIWCCER